MKHLFIPYELALIAKEKGFNEPCIAFINLSMYNLPSQKDRIIIEYSVLGNFEYYNDSSHILSVPIYQQIFDWFREKHGIEIWVSPNIGYTRTTYTWHRTGDLISTTHRNNFEIYNEALISSIEEAFKLI